FSEPGSRGEYPIIKPRPATNKRRAVDFQPRVARSFGPPPARRAHVQDRLPSGQRTCYSSSMKRIIFWTLCAWFAWTPVWAGDNAAEALNYWHQWRGPLATGMAAHGDPPIHWDDKTNIKWKTELPGKGSATPIVWGDQVFLLTAMDTGRAGEAAVLAKEDPRFQKKTKAPTTYYAFVVLCIDRH